MRWLLALLLLTGCADNWTCVKAEVRFQRHPWKPFPAKLATVRCDVKQFDAYLCDDVTLTTDKNGKVHLVCDWDEKAVFDVSGFGSTDGDK